jgi:hypothetical protein
MMGGDSNGVPFKDWAFKEWGDKYGVKAPWMPVDFIKLAKARAQFESEDLARAAWTAYLNNQEPFFAGHDPGRFLSNLSRFIVRAKPKKLHRDPMREDDIWSRKTAALIRIHREVACDDTIPNEKKRDECSRRFREEFPG